MERMDMKCNDGNDKRLSSGNPQLLEVLVHAVAWLLIFGFPLVLMEYNSLARWNGTDYLRHLRMPLAFGVVFYTNYAWLIRHQLFRGGWRRFIFYNLVLLAAVTVLLYFSSAWLYGTAPMLEPPRPRPDGKLPPPRIMFLLRDAMMLVFTVALAVVIRMSREWHNAEEARREAENARREAELKTLRNQLSPHFLLNTLNNIYALISFDTDKAQTAVLELSKMLRHMLYDNNQRLVSLQSEVDFIGNYVELMRLRLSPEVKVVMETDIAPERNTLVAPLIFISLIENAFKHGISSTAPSFVSIRIEEGNGGCISCRIANSNHPKNRQDKSGSGIGLEQVSRRLQLLYPGRYEWHHGVSADGTVYTSELKIHTSAAL